MVRQKRKDDGMNLNEARQKPVRLLSWDDLQERGIKDSKPTIYRKIKAGKFPKPVYPGKSPAWPEPEIDAHMLSLIAQRDAVEVA
jgi:predicted DNA-binding transcriptional regulator AlpA